MEPLVSAAWLAEHLDDADVRVVDATVDVDVATGQVKSGWERWEAGHIPGAVFADLVTDLSDPDASLPFTMPGADRFAAAMGRLGVGDDSRVVVYDARESMWAARLWWMLRAFGFDEAAVLDGGWTTWLQEGRPVSTEAPEVARTTFTPRARPGLVVGKERVVEALLEPGTCIVDRDTQRFLPQRQLREMFGPVLHADHAITYCGGGIAAASDAFALHLVGFDDVAVYDGSMTDWCADPDLPLVTGEQPR